MMLRYARCVAAAVALTIAISGCGGDDEADDTPAPAVPVATDVNLQVVTFDSATALLHSDSRTVQMTVEVAERPDQRAYGLMDRDELDEMSGMIFLYDRMQDGGTGFWMYRTRIPLDIAYFDGSGRIVAIHQMMPCLSLDAAQCVGYAAGTEYLGALEANRGFFARHGIGIGDRIEVPGRLGG